MSVGYLADAFDLLNVRDLDVIKQAGGQVDRLVVGVFTDEYAETLFGRRPVVPLHERMELLSHVRGVHEVVVHDGSEVAVSDHAFVVGDVSSASLVGQVITPGRNTASPVLRGALAPLDEQQENVA